MKSHFAVKPVFRSKRWRVALTLLCLLTFIVDGVVAQAHVHAADRSAHSLDSTKSPARKATTDDGTRCALCQFLATGGTALIPSHAQLTSTAAGSFWISLDHISPASVSAVSFSWQSRGPPLS